MREIKFRAWDKDVKKWRGLWVCRGGHDGEKSHYSKPDIFNMTEIFASQKYGNTKNIVLQQCVICDLFEGDIVRDNKNKKNGWCSAIVWSDYAFRLSKEHPGDRDLYELIDRGRLEVIGNIYENPELISKPTPQ